MPDETKPVEIPVEKKPKTKSHTHKRLKTVEPKWIKKAISTLLHRKINCLLETEPSKYSKEDAEWMLKAMATASKLEKDTLEKPEAYELDET